MWVHTKVKRQTMRAITVNSEGAPYVVDIAARAMLP